ncbi:T9SS type A sorting domain-containing protein [Flavivirga jejuensis]|uniref:T9SS type A sorting domain-containing protein n=1 Tax=Flavivirga jejuensis TaxID=870487 RepID=A0ABT8WK29_9FLAO|nr:T9SS type A sorting domain-containing protein [Flavivirga jejuensis]MDO5973514.1 T9SS type A sorting domain-containing protein [Flavivirga jejuensis]
MKKIQQNIKRNLTLTAFVFTAFLATVCAQSNLTNALGITDPNDWIISVDGGRTVPFTTARGKLQTAGADCFLITADFSPEDFPPVPSGNTAIVYSFTLSGYLVYEIGVINDEGNLRWYVRRPTSISGIGKSVNLDYIIYDDLGVDGTFTFILGHHFTGIGVDEGTSNYKFAPVFFGMDSNLGTLSSHIGELTGETSLDYDLAIFIRNTSKVWKMHGDAQFTTLRSALRHHLSNIQNKSAGTKVAVQPEAIEEGLTDDTIFKDLKLYPNPLEETLYLDFGLEANSAVSFRLFNLKGQLVYEEKEQLFNKGHHKHTINSLGKLPAGIYMLQVKSQEFTESLKLVVK